MSRAVVLPVLFLSLALAACHEGNQDDPIVDPFEDPAVDPSVEPPCGALELRAPTSEAKGNRVWSDDDGPLNGYLAYWGSLAEADTRCGHDVRLEVHDTRRPLPGVVLFLSLDGERVTAASALAPYGTEPATGWIEIGTRGANGRLNGRFHLEGNNGVLEGVFDTTFRGNNLSCNHDSWFSYAEMAAKHRSGDNTLVDCQKPDPKAAGDCIETAQKAGHGFSAVWFDAAGALHAYLGGTANGQPFAERFDFTKAKNRAGAHTEVTTCKSFTRVAGCTDDKASWCWTCTAEGAPVETCREPE